MSTSPLLRVEGLEIAFPGPEGWIPVVRGVSFSVKEGEIVGLVGESGSGKTLSALAALRLVPPPGRVTAGRVLFRGRDVAALSAEELRSLRGGGIGLVFQEPTSALDPVFTVGLQVAEAVRAHRSVSRRQARSEAAELLARVGLADPHRRLGDYPHQLSGGQRQRVLIAIALAGRPSLLIADEPTAALDTTLQAQILELLSRLRAELGLAVLLITHDLAVVARTCQRAVVLYSGEVLENAPVPELFGSPRHPYTVGLLAAVPRLGHPAPRGRMAVIPGQVADPGALPTGCVFHPRCDRVMEICSGARPELVDLRPGSSVRCFLYPGAPQ